MSRAIVTGRRPADRGGSLRAGVEWGTVTTGPLEVAGTSWE